MKKLLLTMTAIGFVTLTNAQGSNTSSNELGIQTGFSTYLGDLIKSNVTYSQAGWANGIYYRHNFGSRVAVKGFANLARVWASDHRDQTDIYRYRRNLSFRNDIVEVGAQAEINLFRLGTFHANNQSDKKYSMFSPYVFAGINFFRHNPKALYKADWVALQPLMTEGVKYSLNQFAVPFGLGFKLQPNARIALALEFGARLTFTDYIDDVSGTYPDLAALNTTGGDLATQMSYRGDKRNSKPNYTWPKAGTKRGNSSDNDWYTVTQFSLGYRLGK